MKKLIILINLILIPELAKTGVTNEVRYTNFYTTGEEIKTISDLKKINDKIFGYRLTNLDLSRLNLTKELNILLNSTYNQHTKFPNQMPVNFNFVNIFEDGKNAGLEIRKLQKSGYTGQGINIAIIDQPLVLDHNEYIGKIIDYENFGYNKNENSSMQGPAITSILAGKESGIAPEIQIYYFAAKNYDYKKDETYLENYIDSLKKIIKLNKKLDDDKKISAVVIPWDLTSDDSEKNFKKVKELISELKESGVAVFTTNNDINGFQMSGLKRRINANSDDTSTYYIEDEFLKTNTLKDYLNYAQTIFVPTGNRTYASFTGSQDYEYSSLGNYAFTAPYLAGLYALAKQVQPKLNQTDFINIVKRTGTTIFYNGEATKSIIVNPKELIKYLEINK